MIFNSLTFIVFFIIVMILHNLPFSWKTKKVNLLLASYIFYAAWNPVFILLLWFSTIIDFFVGKALYNEENKRKKNVLLVVSLIGNLCMLIFFKYGGFLLDNFVTLVNMVGVDFNPAKPNIILPAGISFYTFTTLCYTIDMYKKESKPVKSLLDFSLFVTFFPHLVAGPIVRPPQLVPQFENERKATQQQILQGLFLLTFGLFCKVVLADSMLSVSADAIFNAHQKLLPLDAWMGVLAFSGQIFFDFAGYSTCAVGVAACLGFVLPQNFLYPYAAVGFSDFWRRWHITLSAWLRDYLYIPLGGNRNGKFQTYRNLMITMLLGGLWHGANWTFVAWGGLHGFYLWVEKAILDARKETAKPSFIPKFILAMATFFLVNVTWVFFRAGTFHQAGQILQSMFGFMKNGEAVLSTLAIWKVSLIVVGMVIAQWLMRNKLILEVIQKLSWWVFGTVWAFILLLIIWSQESGNSFIYFQF